MQRRNKTVPVKFGENSERKGSGKRRRKMISTATAQGKYESNLAYVSVGNFKDQIAAFLYAVGKIKHNQHIIDIDFEKLLKSDNDNDTIRVSFGTLERKGGDNLDNND